MNNKAILLKLQELSPDLHWLKLEIESLISANERLQKDNRKRITGYYHSSGCICADCNPILAAKIRKYLEE